MTEPLRNRYIEVGVTVAAVALLIIACVVILRPFFSALLWSAILCISTWPLYLRLEAMTGGRPSLAAGIMVLALALVIIAPFALVGASLASDATSVVAAAKHVIEEGPPAPPDWVASFPLVGSRAHDYWMEMTQSGAKRMEELLKLLPAVKSFLMASGGVLADGIVQLTLSLLVAFFLFRDGGRALAQASAIVAKVAGAEGGRLLEIAGTTVRAVVYGVLGTSILQGTLVAIGFWISGVPGVALLGFCTFILAFIPVGPILVWLPACVWLFREGATGWAIFLAVWSVVMGTVSDNVVKPLLISRGGSTPLILVMLGVLGGVVAFGFIGIFVGPTLLAVGYHVLEEWSPGPAQ